VKFEDLKRRFSLCWALLYNWDGSC